MKYNEGGGGYNLVMLIQQKFKGFQFYTDYRTSLGTHIASLWYINFVLSENQWSSQDGDQRGVVFQFSIVLLLEGINFLSQTEYYVPLTRG